MAKNKNGGDSGEKALLLILSLISVGLLVAIVYVWYNALGNKETTKPGDFLKTEQTTNLQPSTPPSASPSAQVSQATVPLTINSPADQEVVSSKTVTVSGQSLAGAPITIVGGQEDLATAADGQGQFAEKVSLEEGENTLIVTAFDDQGNRSSQTLVLVYAL